MDEDKSIMKASWWEVFLWGKLGLALVGKAMISKSLIQLFDDGWGYGPCISCLAWGPPLLKSLG